PTPGELYPGLRAEADEPALAAEVKGRAAMVDVIAAAVADRQVVPDEPVPIQYEHGTLILEPEVCARARELARRVRQPHNVAREVFEREIVGALANQLADRMRDDVLSIGVPEIDPS